MNFYKFNQNNWSENITKKIILIGLMLSLTFLLHYLTDMIPWPLSSFLKLDFSLLPIIVILFIFDFWYAIFMVLIRFGFAVLITKDPLIWYGPLIEAFFGSMMLLLITASWALFSKLIASKGWVLIATLATSLIILVILASFMNWLWITPLWFNLYPGSTSPLGPMQFNEFYQKNSWVRVMLGGWPTWHIASWATFAPFNIVKFGVIAIVAYPLISVTSIYFLGEKYKLKETKK